MRAFSMIILLLSAISVYSQPGYKCGIRHPMRHASGIAPIPSGHSRLDGDTLYIPITLHILGNNEGSGYYAVRSFFDGLCELNSDFALHHIQFYVEALPLYHNNTLFYNMDNQFFYTDSMFNFVTWHNVVNTMNIYVVDNGAPGLTTFQEFEYDNSTYPPTILNPQNHGIFLAKNALGTYDHFLTHEVGHYLGLWHTFAGWEGFNYLDITGVTPDTIHYAIYDPVEDTIYYNLFWVVERVDGTNCAQSGDLLCDTPPDYLSFLWTCNSDAESPYVQHDPAGQAFRTDGTNYMTYSDDACVNSFSQQQVMMMRDVAKGPRDYLLYNQSFPQTPLENSIHFLWPENNSSVAAEDSVTLQWMPTIGSHFYSLEFGRKVNSNLYIPIARNVVTASTTYKVPIQPGFNYYWILTAFNRYGLCETVIDTSFFGVSPLTSAEEIRMKPLSIYPNPATDQIYWDIPEEIGTSQEITIHNLHGQSILTREASVDRSLEISELSPGLYFLNIRTAKENYGSRLFISNH